MLTVGTRVRTRNSLNRKFADRVGTIVVVNHEEFDPKRKQTEKLKWRDESIEYGVNFSLKEDATNKQVSNGRAEGWFAPHELEAI